MFKSWGTVGLCLWHWMEWVHHWSWVCSSIPANSDKPEGQKSSIIMATLLRSCANHSLWSNCSPLVKTHQEQSLVRDRFRSKSTALWTNYAGFFVQLGNRIKSSEKTIPKQKWAIKNWNKKTRAHTRCTLASKKVSLNAVSSKWCWWLLSLPGFIAQ